MMVKSWLHAGSMMVSLFDDDADGFALDVDVDAAWVVGFPLVHSDFLNCSW